MLAGGGKGDEDTLKDEEGEEEWVNVSGNAYGAFIHVGLQSGSSNLFSTESTQASRQILF